VRFLSNLILSFEAQDSSVSRFFFWKKAYLFKMIFLMKISPWKKKYLHGQKKKDRSHTGIERYSRCKSGLVSGARKGVW